MNPIIWAVLLVITGVRAHSAVCSVCPPEYAQVIKMLGNGRLEAMCFDGTKRLCHIRGKLRKKVEMSVHPLTSLPSKLTEETRRGAESAASQ